MLQKKKPEHNSFQVSKHQGFIVLLRSKIPQKQWHNNSWNLLTFLNKDLLFKKKLELIIPQKFYNNFRLPPGIESFENSFWLLGT